MSGFHDIRGGAEVQRILRSISKEKSLYQPITMSYGHSARGAVHPQSTGGVETHGGVILQRWGWNAKGCGQIAKAFREWGRNAKGRAETRPDALNYLLLPLT